MSFDHDYVWKVVVAGDGGVGKTTIIHRYVADEFLDMLKMTIGCDFHTQLIEKSGKKISLVLWDLGGQDRFRFFQDRYMQGASGCFLCFDMSRYATLENCHTWIEMLKNNCPEAPIILVGTKLDLVNNEIEYADIKSSASKLVDEFEDWLSLDRFDELLSRDNESLTDEFRLEEMLSSERLSLRDEFTA